MKDVDIYGRIAGMHFITHPEFQTDLLFITTEKHKYVLYAWNPSSDNCIYPVSSGDLHEKNGFPTDIGAILIVDPTCQIVAFHGYQGLLKVLPISGSKDTKGKRKDTFSSEQTSLKAKRGVKLVESLLSAPTANANDVNILGHAYNFWYVYIYIYITKQELKFLY